MFLWLKVKEIKDTYKMISEGAAKKHVVLVPGSAFMTDSSKPSPYLRASFSIAPPHLIDKVEEFTTLK